MSLKSRVLARDPGPLDRLSMTRQPWGGPLWHASECRDSGPSVRYALPRNRGFPEPRQPRGLQDLPEGRRREIVTLYFRVHGRDPAGRARPRGRGSTGDRPSSQRSCSRIEILRPARHRRHREPLAPPPARRAPPLVAASPAPQAGPMADRDAGDPNALAARSGDRGTTRDGSLVASSGMAAVVALPLEPSGRPAADRRRVAGPHPADVAGEPPVGREPDCWRARETRLAGLAAHGGEVPVLVRNHPRRAGCQGANVLVGVSPQWGEI